MSSEGKSRCWIGLKLDWNFGLPVFEGEAAQLGCGSYFSPLCFGDRRQILAEETGAKSEIRNYRRSSQRIAGGFYR